MRRKRREVRSGGGEECATKLRTCLEALTRRESLVRFLFMCSPNYRSLQHPLVGIANHRHQHGDDLVVFLIKLFRDV